jgi:hypothetical protein
VSIIGGCHHCEARLYRHPLADKWRSFRWDVHEVDGRLEVQHVPSVAKSLLAVDLEHGHQVGQPVMGGEHRCFPYRPFVELCITQHRVCASRRAVEPGGQRRSGGERQPVPERAGGEINPLLHVLGMAGKSAPIGAIRVDLGLSDPAGRLQRAVKRERGVPLREHEPVAVRVLGPDVRQRPREQSTEDVGDRQRRSDVAYVSALGLLDRGVTNRVGDSGGFDGHS